MDIRERIKNVIIDALVEAKLQEEYGGRRSSGRAVAKTGGTAGRLAAGSGGSDTATTAAPDSGRPSLKDKVRQIKKDYKAEGGKGMFGGKGKGKDLPPKEPIGDEGDYGDDED